MKQWIEVLQVVSALGLINVWIIRYEKGTAYRGGNATNLKDEFKIYGLPVWFHYFVGVLKLCGAAALVVGIWMQSLIFPASAVICVLMLGALSMHLKVRDPLIKYLPAFSMLVINTVIFASNMPR